MEYLKFYLSQLADLHTQQCFEDEMLNELDEFLVSVTKAYTSLFKEAFPHRANEPFGLMGPQRERTWENVNSLLQKLDTRHWDIVHWARRFALVDLGQANIRRNALTKGEELWTKQFRSVKDRIDAVMMQFEDRGHPLQYVGSLNNGTRGAHKGRTAININDFDVDLFVVHPVEWHKHLPGLLESFPANVSNGKIFPSGINMQELHNFSYVVGKALARELRGYVKNARKLTESTEIVLRERDAY